MYKLTSAGATAKTGSDRPSGPGAYTPASPTDTLLADAGLGVYVHFPWCIKKCPYCDFLSVPSARAEIPHERYADAVLSEIAARRRELGPQEVLIIFFGGVPGSLGKLVQLLLVL